MNIKRTWIIPIMSRWLVCLSLVLFNGVLLAQEDGDDSCQLTTIKAAFKVYVQSATQAQVVDIQDRLIARGYGPIESDGVLGSDTRRELLRFCLANDGVGTSPAEDIASVLVELLHQSPPEQPQLEQEQQAVESEPSVPAVTSDQKQLVDVATDKAAQATQSEAGALVNYRWIQPEAPEESLSEDALAKEIPEAVTEMMAGIEGVTFANEFMFTQAIKALFAKSGVEYKPHLEEIITQSRIAPTRQLASLDIAGSDCGCSRDFSSLVYGFFPYWLADGEQQAIDFSLFDRIGFYSLALNEQGGIDKLLQWENESEVGRFIHTAHKHRVGVDISVQANAWQSWDELALQRALASTVELVTRSFQDSSEGMLGKLSRLGGKDAYAQVDGVTLVFNDYTESMKNRVNIINYVTQLSEELAKRKRKYQINIMLNLDVSKLEQQTAFKDLDSILLGEAAPVNNLFVFLQQPTSAAKKLLRRVIEDEFRGGQRREMLRKIVPIISPHGHENEARGPYSQFIDDIIYFQDNFAGTGLWPLPLANDDGIDTIRSNIIELYAPKDENKFVTQLLDEHLPSLCQFACPNRWGFRLAFNILAIAFVLYGIAAIWFYQLRTVFTQYIALFAVAGAMTVVILLTSLVCDPFWRDRADLVMGGSLFIIVAAIISRYVIKSMRPPLP